MNVAIKKYNQKVEEVHLMYNEEIKRLAKDFNRMRDMVFFYEDKIKQLVRTTSRLERMIIEINQYFHQLLRLREDYLANKEDAKLTVTEVIRRKFAMLTNCDFLD